MFTIGLTGGIASGKSEAAKAFAAAGAAVIDTDELAREVLQPGSPGIVEVAAAFGGHLLRADGSLDRRALRHIVFSDPQARKRLEAITHPRIKALLRTRLAATANAPYAVVEIPLLAESGLAGELDRILVIDAPEPVRIERLMQRDGETSAEAHQALSAQVSRESRLEQADDVIRNEGDKEKLRQAVARLHDLYLGLASQPGSAR